MEYPLRVEEYSFVENSGGAGKYRGGLGIRRIIRPIAHKCEFSGVGERFQTLTLGGCLVVNLENQEILSQT